MHHSFVLFKTEQCIHLSCSRRKSAIIYVVQGETLNLLNLDLGFLTKTRKYTFFSPKFIFYATYLSEKIGYWRYIVIYRHLEKNPNFRVYPLFRFFESWCQDENRHGDFFAAILKSQKHLLNTFESRLWCKFFLLSVFATMYLNDTLRSDFYATIGLDTKQFDKHVIRKTS